MMSNNENSAALAKIATINVVEGFDPTPLAVEYADMNTGEKRKRLPVIIQVAWFRLKYPEGRFTLHVEAVNDFFVATARVYKHYTDPADCFLSEATASRGYLPDKPTVSPREWAQTAALGIALRYAGFGLQFHAAGDSFDETATDEFGELASTQSDHAMNAENASHSGMPMPGECAEAFHSAMPTATQPVEDPLEAAMKMPCPITKYSGKTLGELVVADPRAIIWVATKFTGNPDISAAAKLICDHSLETAA